MADNYPQMRPTVLIDAVPGLREGEPATGGARGRIERAGLAATILLTTAVGLGAVLTPTLHRPAACDGAAGKTQHSAGKAVNGGAPASGITQANN